MRVLLAGQKRFGRDVLELILSRGHEVLGVSCPVREDDRLWIATQNSRLRVIPSGTLQAATMPLGCDLIVAAHCHEFLSAKTRQRATLGALGYHPSLLPRHRGRSAIEWTVRFRDPIAGGSVFWLNDVVDGGAVAAQDFCFVRPEDSALSLWQRELAPMGLLLFGQVLDRLGQGIVHACPQDTALATWEPAVDDVPPLWRPDVPQLGASAFEVIPQRLGAE